MIRQAAVNAVADEPADRDVDLRLPKQSTDVNDPEQLAREHQLNRQLCLGIQ